MNVFNWSYRKPISSWMISCFLMSQDGWCHHYETCPFEHEPILNVVVLTLVLGFLWLTQSTDLFFNHPTNPSKLLLMNHLPLFESEDFNQPLERVQLPSGLQSLSFGEEFDQSLEYVNLPKLQSAFGPFCILGLKHPEFSFGKVKSRVKEFSWFVLPLKTVSNMYVCCLCIVRALHYLWC